MSSLRPVALGSRLADILRAAIVRGELAPGVHLVEDALAARYEISRGPVRDALRLLTSEGLIESRKRGFYVKAFTEGDIHELYQIRLAAEQLAGSLAIQRSEPADWARAEGLVSELRSAADADDQHRYAQADLAFHTEFYTNSRNGRLLSLWRQFQPTFAALLDVTNAQDKDLHPSAEDHALLLQLARDRNVDRYAAELENHLQGSLRRMLTAVTARATKPEPASSLSLT